MKIKVLGTGCPKCNHLYAAVEKAIEMAGETVELEKVQEIDDILAYGIMMVPGLVIDEKVKCSGKVPRAEQIVSWIKESVA